MRIPIHPGEHLADDLEAMEMTAAELAERLQVPNNTVADLLEGRSALDADMALRLGKFLGTSPGFWLNLQKTYELDLARERMGDTLDRITARADAPIAAE